ncbi:Dephospho-CoA kinase [Legionella massiliensis]|uniref:Dephospho-CoA kinase n=1 Tax=Legionella massiliensis TaxID=1034943 RepID=A0A078L382_9GAMM|nr:dephospho-CoA kinase [Legionella massiliensis]CDZ78408.1 Dephospho-CoA kinase [Legionella massiliensis]CEE14146.1 Dephospho-CoA kinase [Legionella massiliensis]
MFCIGLTGTIASGKSTVSHLFQEQGVVVISADEAARALTAINQPALNAIAKHFSQAVISPSGELNRAALREIIFRKPQERIWLEQLLHPLIRQYMKDKVVTSVGPYALIEIPLLNSRSDYPYLDRVLLVLANREQQIERVMQRDNCSRTQAESILAVQSNEEAKKKLADDIILNDSTLDDLAKKIEILHGQYLQLASQKS